MAARRTSATRSSIVSKSVKIGRAELPITCANRLVVSSSSPFLLSGHFFFCKFRFRRHLLPIPFVIADSTAKSACIPSLPPLFHILCFLYFIVALFAHFVNTYIPMVQKKQKAPAGLCETPHPPDADSLILYVRENHRASLKQPPRPAHGRKPLPHRPVLPGR